MIEPPNVNTNRERDKVLNSVRKLEAFSRRLGLLWGLHASLLVILFAALVLFVGDLRTTEWRLFAIGGVLQVLGFAVGYFGTKVAARLLIKKGAAWPILDRTERGLGNMDRNTKRRLGFVLLITMTVFGSWGVVYGLNVVLVKASTKEVLIIGTLITLYIILTFARRRKKFW